MKEKFDNIVIIIPVLNPNECIVKLINELKNLNFNNIIVIDDGSLNETQIYFEILNKNFSNIKIYKHEKNYGKGHAIKTGIKKIENENISGIITVDADGQHLATDVKKVAEKLINNDNIILGTRNIFKNKDTPFFSKLGNIFSSLYYKMITGVYLKDTQTGLRGIPKKYFCFALNVEGDRYEYEMNFLKQMFYKKIKFDIVEIETVYKNRTKNFKIIKDSYIIYKDFFKNLISSLVSAVFDVVIFWIFILQNISIFNSNILARILSGILDFYLNKKWVFEDINSKSAFREILEYLALFIFQMLLNTILIMILNVLFNKLLIIKILVNFVLYIINFSIKRRYIFCDK